MKAIWWIVGIGVLLLTYFTSNSDFPFNLLKMPAFRYFGLALVAYAIFAFGRWLLFERPRQRIDILSPAATVSEGTDLAAGMNKNLQTSTRLESIARKQIR